MAESESNLVRPVIIPQVGVNDDHVTISQVEVEAGQQVRRGDLLFSFATTKADVEVEAEMDGYFWPVVVKGDQLAVGATAAYLSLSPEQPEEFKQTSSSRSEIETDGQPRATRKAIELASKLGVDLRQIEHHGIIREQDVEAFSSSRDDGEVRKVSVAQAPARISKLDGGQLDKGFLRDIQHKESGFAALSSELKILLYRRFGAQIGKDVSFARGAAIYAEQIQVGDDCTFGENTVIRSESLMLGRGCLLGHDNDIICRHIRIGDMLFLVNRVLVGQGGAFNEEAALVVGHSCLISSDCLINTAHRVTIGDVSCLSPRVSIYTHSHWQNILEGYSVNFAPVQIGNNVWITGNCLVTPGAVMEDGSQSLANSVIVGHVPARTIVAGVPAKILTKVRGRLSPAEKDRVMRERVWPAIEGTVRQAGLNPSDVIYAAHAPAAESDKPVQIGFGERPQGYEGTYFDLENYQVSGTNSPLVDEVRNVLRKHGIRFSPYTWRYRADAGKYNA